MAEKMEKTVLNREERIEQQLQFIVEIDKLKSVFRQTYLADSSRKENDTEHSWHLAMMAILLSEYANEPVDVLRVTSMVLLHDVIEIDAGDTYAYDEEAKKTQHERELQGADRIFNLLPEDQAKYVRELWDEFEAWETPEAKFARTLDNLQPLLLNDASGGRSWREHGTRVEQPYARNKRTHEGSEELWKVAEKLIQKHADLGNLKK